MAIQKITSQDGTTVELLVKTNEIIIEANILATAAIEPLDVQSCTTTDLLFKLNEIIDVVNSEIP